MTFPIVMFVVGALMLAVGVLGKIQIREIVSEASGKTARIALTFAGVSLMVLACFMYRTEPPTLPGLPAAQQAKADSQAAPGQPAVSITSPASDHIIDVQLVENGGGAFEVRGTSLGIANDPNRRIVLLLHPEKPFAAGWWIQPVPVVDSDGKWSVQAWIGNSQFLPAKGDTLMIQAVAASGDIQGQSRVDEVKDLNPVVQSRVIKLTIDKVKKPVKR
jgi:hypothetical protein